MNNICNCNVKRLWLLYSPSILNLGCYYKYFHDIVYQIYVYEFYLEIVYNIYFTLPIKGLTVGSGIKKKYYEHINICHFCGTKPSIKPLTTNRFKKPLPFSFVRVISALYRKNQSRNSYRFLD